MAAAARQARVEWFGSPPHLFMLSRPMAEGFAAFPRDSRPARAELGRGILNGTYALAGDVLRVGLGGDPWNRNSPSRAFAVELHKFGWLRHLLATGEAGAREGLRLIGEWARTFGGWNSFSWSGEVLERRTLNLTCAMGPIAALASEAEVQMLAGLLARHARHLVKVRDPAWRAAERAVVVGAAAATLSGRAGDRLLTGSLARIDRAIARAVLPDGGHVSRSPETGMELLLDLLCLDDGWAQRGFETPEEAARAIDRMTVAMRFFTLPDARLACAQGGEESDPALVIAARVHDDADAAGPSQHAPHAGYHRLVGQKIQVMVDVGKTAPSPWSVSSCAHTGAIEVVCGRDRLITNSGWSLRAPQSQALRLTDSGSTVSLGHDSCGAPLSGWRARVLGPRLIGGPVRLDVKRTQSQTGVWLDIVHDGWLASQGLIHERRLYLDLTTDELRGEDQFIPQGPSGPARVIPYSVQFHLPPEVEAVIARDHKSVLLRGPSEAGWWLRNDAVDVRVEPAVHFRDGRQVPTQQVVLMGHIRADKGGRVRWKLAAVDS